MADSRTTKGLKIAGSVAGVWFILFSLIFLFIGIIFIIVSAVISNVTEEQSETYLPTEAVITEIRYERDSDGELSRYPHIKYTVDGKEYNTALDFYSSSMYEGQTITILYHPETPSRIVYEEGTKTLTFVFGIVGGVMLVIGLVPFITGLILMIACLKKPKAEVSVAEEVKATDYSGNYKKDDDRYGGLGEGIE